MSHNFCFSAHIFVQKELSLTSGGVHFGVEKQSWLFSQNKTKVFISMNFVSRVFSKTWDCFIYVLDTPSPRVTRIHVTRFPLAR